MSFKEKLLNKSNSHVYYKENYESLKKLNDDSQIQIEELDYEMNFDKMNLAFMAEELKNQRHEINNLNLEKKKMECDANYLNIQKDIYNEEIGELNNLTSNILNKSFEIKDFAELGLFIKLFNYKFLLDSFNDDARKVYSKDFARIDLKNFGSIDNSVVIIENSDENSNEYSPNWINDIEGNGLILESFSGNLDLKIKIIRDGILRLNLRSLNLKDTYESFVDYTSLKINGITYLENHNLYSHEKPYIYEKYVKDGDIFDIHLEWVTYDRKNPYNGYDDKEVVYSKIRRELLQSNIPSENLKRLPLNLYSFYIKILNYDTYSGFINFENNLRNNYHFINKEKLQTEIDNYTQFGLNNEKRDNLIIVSLTSYPERMDDIHFCLYSLLKQNLKPDKVILWLAEEQFPNKEEDVPKNVLKLKNNGLSIKWCKDIKSYKKLVPILKEYPDDFIVTVDDDIYYHENWLEKIWSTYLDNPNTIISSRPRIISQNLKKELLCYKDWKLTNSFAEPSFLNFPTGAGGTMYFPNALSKEIFNESKFMELCPTADDVWFWAMAVLNESKITGIEDPYNTLTYINIAREIGVIKSNSLWNLNKHGENDNQINNILKEFPNILEILNDD